LNTPKVDPLPRVLKIGGDPAPPPAKKENEIKPDTGAKVTASKAVSASTAGSGKASPAATAAEKAAQQAAERREADAVAKEQEDEIEDSVIEELYGKVCSLYQHFL
jgi:peptide chain release factor subunit 3